MFTTTWYLILGSSIGERALKALRPGVGQVARPTAVSLLEPLWREGKRVVSVGAGGGGLEGGHLGRTWCTAPPCAFH